jgi:ATP-dependent 26S proteasome regulatory subunit
LMDFSSASLSDILNAIDGVISRHGRILVMTTNHPEKIDEAMLRPGRVDLKLEIGFMDVSCFEMMLRKFFDDIPADYFHGFELSVKNLTGSMVQGDIRNKMGYFEITEKYRHDG